MRKLLVLMIESIRFLFLIEIDKNFKSMIRFNSGYKGQIFFDFSLLGGCKKLCKNREFQLAIHQKTTQDVLFCIKCFLMLKLE